MLSATFSLLPKHTLYIVPYWGKGLIPEAVHRLLEHCFEDLGIKRVWCGYYDGNFKSRRVMDKCGFKFHHTEQGKPSH